MKEKLEILKILKELHGQKFLDLRVKIVIERKIDKLLKEI